VSRGRRRAPRASGGRPAGPGRRGASLWVVIIGAVAIIAAAAVVAIGRDHGPAGPAHAAAAGPLTSRPGSYLGVYKDGAPDSYAGLTAFTRATGVRPDLVSYYSGWLEPFRAGFAATAARHGAVPLIQLEPTGISLAAIAAGRYDAYLRSYAAAVRSYRDPVILSFCHEMNAWWYSWGYRGTSPATFIAAWRHVVTLFRAAGARNVTWLWTVNVIDADGGIRAPAAWWPGRAYVDWIGLDGYYKQAGTFAPLFGPTIKAVRALARDPVLIAETGVAPATDKPAKITNLFAGVRAYGLLGLVWFDAVGIKDWRLDSPAATSAFRRGAAGYGRGSS
jgi:mannan endo-1,4-beta-mannosidase